MNEKDHDESFDLTSVEESKAFKLGVRAAAALLDDYDHLSSHKYRLRDCVLVKFGLLDKAKMRRNANCDMEQIIRIVAKNLATTRQAILSKLRMKRLTRARHLCEFLGWKVLGLSHREIAEKMGLDSTSVTYGITQGRKGCSSGLKAWKATVDKIVSEIEG